MAAQATKPGGLWNVRSQEIESLSLNYDVFGKGGKNINPIQDGPFWGCSLKSVTHIPQWWNLAQLCIT